MAAGQNLPSLCPVCAARRGLIEQYRAAATTCPDCGAEWQHGRWARFALWKNQVKARLRDALIRREALIEAQVAILRHQDTEQAIGVDRETEEFDQLHAEFWRLRRGMAWWEAFGVLDTARARRADERGNRQLTLVDTLIAAVLTSMLFTVATVASGESYLSGAAWVAVPPVWWLLAHGTSWMRTAGEADR